MDSKKEIKCSDIENDVRQGTPAKSNEMESDRESSIESFYTNTSEFSTAAETELIDVDAIELSDEESWLYKSPRKMSSTEKTLSTCMWLNKNVEDLSNLELQRTKDALVKKLEELQLHDSSLKKEKNIDEDFIKEQFCDTTTPTSFASQSCASTPVLENASNKLNSPKAILDASEVQKIAQMQEERLRQPSSRLLFQAVRKNSLEQNSSQVHNSRLTKPASFEALNICNARFDDIISSHPVKNHIQFGSTSALNTKQDVHRGSLPNINRGYNSLRSKKSNRSTDPKKSCPLPMYPSHSRLPLNGVEAFNYESQSKPARCGDFHESRTLPSSYRLRSRSSYRDASLTPSPRRESIPLSPTFKRRESAPNSPQKSPASFLSNNMYQRNGIISSSVTQGSSKGNYGSSHPKTPPSGERNAYSVKRLPLSTMLNHSPKRGNSPALPRKEESRGLKSPSKIASTVMRSGIPLSASYMKGNEDDSWSHDCF